ncbi:MAG: phage integrase N-terminal SAM-like domain-containing protein [Candidatus Marinimicrobia bacterium]|nr:phage integrase N-terminal SAM-like domain-containing protein [Candidatus Neomarinimicrobiota bacterium]
MTFLRKRFIEDMQLYGYCQRTIDAYVRAVRQLAKHYHKSPDKITEEEHRQYFLNNKNIRKWSRVASTISLCCIKFFFEKTLKKEWTTFKLVRPPKEKKLLPIL